MNERYGYQIDVNVVPPEKVLSFLCRVKQEMREALGRGRVFTQKTPLRQFVEDVFADE